MKLNKFSRRLALLEQAKSLLAQLSEYVREEEAELGRVVGDRPEPEATEAPPPETDPDPEPAQGKGGWITSKKDVPCHKCRTRIPAGHKGKWAHAIGIPENLLVCGACVGRHFNETIATNGGN